MQHITLSSHEAVGVCSELSLLVSIFEERGQGVMKGLSGGGFTRHIIKIPTTRLKSGRE